MTSLIDGRLCQIDRARVKLRSGLYDTMGEFGGFGLMDLLASSLSLTTIRRV